MFVSKVGGRLEVGGWLPVSLTELGHWHGFIKLTDDGAVSTRRPTERKQKEGNSVGSLKKGEKREVECGAPWHSEGSAGPKSVETTLPPCPDPRR